MLAYAFWIVFIDINMCLPYQLVDTDYVVSCNKSLSNTTGYFEERKETTSILYLLLFSSCIYLKLRTGLQWRI